MWSETLKNARYFSVLDGFIAHSRRNSNSSVILTVIHHFQSPSSPSPSSPSGFASAGASGSVSGVGSGYNGYSLGSLKTVGGCTGKKETSSYL